VFGCKAQKKGYEFNLLNDKFETFNYSEFERQNKKYQGIDKDGFEEEFEVKDVNPIVLNGLNVETTQHDFFSKKSTNYEKALEVVHLHDDDFEFKDNEIELEI